MHDLGYHGERPSRAAADARRQEKFRKPAFGRCCERAVQRPRKDVAWSDIVVCRHDESRRVFVLESFGDGTFRRRSNTASPLRSAIIDRIMPIAAETTKIFFG